MILGIDLQSFLKRFLAFSCVRHLMWIAGELTNNQWKPFILNSSTSSNCPKVLSTAENTIHELQRYEYMLVYEQKMIAH